MGWLLIINMYCPSVPACLARARLEDSQVAKAVHTQPKHSLQL